MDEEEYGNGKEELGYSDLFYLWMTDTLTYNFTRQRNDFKGTMS
jgi:hypothetical protein